MFRRRRLLILPRAVRAASEDRAEFFARDGSLAAYRPLVDCGNRRGAGRFLTFQGAGRFQARLSAKQRLEAAMLAIVRGNEHNVAGGEDRAVQPGQNLPGPHFHEDRHSLVGQPLDQLHVADRPDELGGEIAPHVLRIGDITIGHAAEHRDRGRLDGQLADRLPQRLLDLLHQRRMKGTRDGQRRT